MTDETSCWSEANKKFFSWLKNGLLCPFIRFLNLFWVILLTLFLVYVSCTLPNHPNNVKLCNGDKEIPQEQGCKISCCGSSGSNGITYGLCKAVEKTTQATIILMLVVLTFLSLEVYCGKNKPNNNTNGESSKPSENGVDGKPDGEQLDKGSNREEESKNEGHNSKETDKERRNNVITVLIATLGASAIPTGISLIICAFYDMRWMQLLSGVEAYIAFAGISIIAIAFLSVSDEEKGNLGRTPSSPKISDTQEK